MTPLEIFNVVKEVLLMLAALVTAGAAVYALHTWKRELKGKAEFEVARSLAKATYLLRDELGYCRAPFLRSSEFLEGDSSSAESYAHLLVNRWRPLREAICAFEASALEAESLWGSASRDNTGKLMACVRTLHVATESLQADKVVKGENFKADREFGRRTRSDVFGVASDMENPLSAAIANAVLAIEAALTPHLSQR